MRVVNVVSELVMVAPGEGMNIVVWLVEDEEGDGEGSAPGEGMRKVEPAEGGVEDEGRAAPTEGMMNVKPAEGGVGDEGGAAPTDGMMNVKPANG